MKYSLKTKCALLGLSDSELNQLLIDIRKLDIDLREGASPNKVRLKFVTRIWLEDIGDFKFTGGTRIVKADSDEYYIQSDMSWLRKIQNTYISITETTNRKLFGRRYKQKIAYPKSLVFFEKNANSGRHIHSIHNFPTSIESKTEDWLQLFAERFNNHELNKNVGRTFWFEEVKSQQDIRDYVTKQITENYENGWFSVI